MLFDGLQGPIWYDPIEGHWYKKKENSFICGASTLARNFHARNCRGRLINLEVPKTCPGVHGRFNHNHQPIGRDPAEFLLLRWSVRLKMTKERLTATVAMEEVMKTWPFVMKRNPAAIVVNLKQTLMRCRLWATAKHNSRDQRERGKWLHLCGPKKLEAAMKALQMSSGMHWPTPDLGK